MLGGDLGEMELVEPEEFTTVGFGSPVFAYLVLPPDAGSVAAWRCGSLHLAIPAADPGRELRVEEWLAVPRGWMLRVASVSRRAGRVRVELLRTE